MDPIQNAYHRFESTRDQYVGRVDSILPLISSKFTALPPEFDCRESGTEISSEKVPSLAKYIH